MTCEELGKTQLIIDCFGPLIDISKISEFSKVQFARYLQECELAEALNRERGSGAKWEDATIRGKTKQELQHPKLASRLIDDKMVKLLCLAKSFCDIKIISAVPDVELYESAKKVLIDYSTQMITYGTSIMCGGNALAESDFSHVQPENNLPGVIRWYTQQSEEDKKSKAYKIVVDDAPVPFNVSSLFDKGQFPFQKWIGGIQEDDPATALEKIIESRKKISRATDAVINICRGEKIDLKKYTILESYYVYSDELRTQLNKRILAIRGVRASNRTRTKPVCVFLAGTPGTGKSYFVEQFAKFVDSDSDYPVTSLSGVSSDLFYDAIQHHVEQVYNTKHKGENSVAVAFLDEIDTQGDYFAFRFLMDAMTGTRTDEHGVTMKGFKSGTVENLIWFFAGSAGASRQEFINNLQNDERKVTDFFDRIHFDMTLPSVSEPGQAILTLMSAIKEYFGKDNLPGFISEGVLFTFARTEWTSTRSIMTICRVAAAHNGAMNGKIVMKLFEDIDTFDRFSKQYRFIKETIGDGKEIPIDW